MVWTGGRAPSTSTASGGIPSSSSVSRSAVVRRSGSSSCRTPPGKEISPLWWSTSSVRSVNRSDGLGPSTSGTSTPAGVPSGSGGGGGGGGGGRGGDPPPASPG